MFEDPEERQAGEEQGPSTSRSLVSQTSFGPRSREQSCSAELSFCRVRRSCPGRVQDYTSELYRVRGVRGLSFWDDSI